MIRKLLLILAVAWSFSTAAFGQTSIGPVVLNSALSTCGTAGSSAVLNISPNLGAVGISIQGTFTATLAFKGTVDGANYSSIQAFPLGSSTPVTTAAAAGSWSLSTAGLRAICVNMTAYTSGAAVVLIQGSNASSGSVSGGTGGAVTIANGADVVLGSTTDDRCTTTDTTACTIDALIKQTNYLLNNPVCDQYVFDSSSTGDVQLVAASGSTIIYICGYSIVGTSTTTSTVNLRWATASDCTTGATSLTPPITVGTDPAGAMTAGKVVSPSGWNGLASPSTRNLCVHRTAAVTSAVEVWYGQR